MNTLQHSLITLLETRDWDMFSDIIPYVLLPDAIRYYIGERRWSHFETHPELGESNQFQFPIKVSEYDKIDLKKCVTRDIPLPKAAIGEFTMIQAFEEANEHLPDIMFIGIREHLRQDVSFDKWVRSEYDCTEKYQDRFVVNGEEMNGKDFRHVIQDMEMDAVVCLAYMCYKELGEKITNDWIKQNIFEPLSEVYPDDMLENTCKYLHIPPEMERQILDDEWEQLLGKTKYLTLDNYQRYHYTVIEPIDTLDRTAEYQKRENECFAIDEEFWKRE